MGMRKTMYRFEQKGPVHKLYVYDDVTAVGPFNWETWEYGESETSADYFRRQLEGIPDTDTIELHVNSNGGDVKEGVAIYDMLRRHKVRKVCYVDGFAYSIASVICMACDRIVMGLGTSMLIHNMAAYAYGNATQLRKLADDLDVLMESNRKIYMERARGLTEGQLADMMDRETFLTPEQCLEYGFCDEIGPDAADPGLTLEQAGRTIRELRQELNRQKSFREELAELAVRDGKGGPGPENGQGPRQSMNQETNQEPNKGSERALKMMGVFLDAITRKAE